MQIHELTRIDEAGVMDYIKAAMSTDPNLKGYSMTQKARAVQNNKVINQLGEVLAQQWLAKAAILAKQAAAQPAQYTQQPQQAPAQQTAQQTATTSASTTKPIRKVKVPGAIKEANAPVQIAPEIYKKYLEDFVNKTAFRNQMKYLDPSSKSQVDADISQIVANQSNPQKMIQLFQKLAQTAAVALMTTPGSLKSTPVSAASGTAPTSAPGKQQAGAPATPLSSTAVTPATLKNTLNSMGVYINPSSAALRQAFEKFSGDIRVESTGNEYADSLLTLFGFDVQ